MAINDNIPSSPIYGMSSGFVAASSTAISSTTGGGSGTIYGILQSNTVTTWDDHQFDLAACPECKETTDQTDRELLLLAPEVCACDPSNPHTIDQWWHRACYDQQGRNLQEEWEEAFSELQADIARHTPATRG